MGTGIVSAALSLDGREVLSRVLLVVAAAVWLALGSLLAARLRRDLTGVRRDATSPAALTGVAATAVLAVDLLSLGWQSTAIALLVVATGLWAALLPQVLRHWTTPTTGVSLMLTVSTESLAVLTAALASGERARWLVLVSLVPLCAGLAFYGYTIVHFDLRELVTGAGDQWITGGALAISTLAAARIALAASTLRVLPTVALQAVSIALWVVTVCWLPPLLIAEARFARFGYDVRRWSTVFPFGMYAACSFAVGAIAHTEAIRIFARAWVWVAFAVWVVVLAAMLRTVAVRRSCLPTRGAP